MTPNDVVTSLSPILLIAKEECPKRLFPLLHRLRRLNLSNRWHKHNKRFNRGKPSQNSLVLYSSSRVNTTFSRSSKPCTHMKDSTKTPLRSSQRHFRGGERRWRIQPRCTAVSGTTTSINDHNGCVTNAKCTRPFQSHVRSNNPHYKLNKQPTRLFCGTIKHDKLLGRR